MSLYSELFDENHDNVLTIEEIVDGSKKLALKENWPPINPRQMYVIFTFFDKNKNETIEVDEFYSLILCAYWKYSALYYSEMSQIKTLKDEILRRGSPDPDDLIMRIESDYKFRREIADRLYDDNFLRIFYRTAFMEADKNGNW